jgi:hypothetical protein
VTRDELEHAIRAACDVVRETEVYVFGSQAILGQFPDAPDTIRMSAEADIAPKNFPDRSESIDGALGELSPFHIAHGFYVHGIDLTGVVLPADWAERAIKVQNASTRQNIGWCLEGHDLAASKLMAFRDKDREFVRVLLSERMISAAETIRRLHMIPDRSTEKQEHWIRKTETALGLAKRTEGSTG